MDIIDLGSWEDIYRRKAHQEKLILTIWYNFWLNNNQYYKFLPIILVSSFKFV